MALDIKKLTKWEIVTEFGVGGLLWVGFSKEQPDQLLCISSQKTTVCDCRDGSITECDCEYDEEDFSAICNHFPNEIISIAGQYGGVLEQTTKLGESVVIQTEENHITSVHLCDENKCRTMIFQGYGFYTCGFNHTGEYFVFSHDGGISILKRM